MPANMMSLQQLTMGKPAEYMITVKGRLDAERADWFDGMIVEVKRLEGFSVTCLSGTVVDQAALQGVLRNLYMLGMPLIGIELIDISG